jgi:hypothetical protein
MQPTPGIPFAFLVEAAASLEKPAAVLLVLMGMLGTLLGMMATLKGTGFALQSATDLAGG